MNNNDSGTDPVQSVMDAAVGYSMQRNWSVFPCHTPIKDGGCSCGNRECDRVGKHPRTRYGLKDATKIEEEVRQLWWQMRDANIGMVTGASSGIIAIDVDGPEALAALKKFLGGPPPITLISKTGREGGYHLIYRSDEPVKTRTGILPRVDVRAEGAYIILPPSLHQSGRRYQWVNPDTPIAPLPDQLRDLIMAENGKAHHPSITSMVEDDRIAVTVPVGQRNDTLTRLAGSLFGQGLPVEEVARRLHADNKMACEVPLPDAEVDRIVASIAKRHAEKTDQAPYSAYSAPSEATKWPEPLGSAAYHGLIGKIVRAIEPHTEADPAAILAQILVMAGNTVGRGPHFRVGADRHGLNLFTVICGPTGEGGKGMSWGVVRDLFERAGPTWLPHCKGALASGEALVWQVRDDSTNVKGEVIPGVEDKRLLIVEGEFMTMLTIMARSGNTLSPVVRLAWDGITLHNITKGEPVTATDPHISFICHGTPQEIRRRLDQTELFNGFFNRFLLVLARRSKDLPHGGELDDETLNTLAGQLRLALEKGKAMGRMYRSNTARSHWEKVYKHLKRGKLGLVGAATSRATAQVTRISCIYAMLDGSPCIEVCHTEAALEVWRYIEQSTMYLFGGGFGDADLDRLWGTLQAKGATGMTTTEIHQLFNNHSKRAMSALTTLEEQKYVTSKKLPTSGAPKIIWYAIGAEKAD